MQPFSPRSNGTGFYSTAHQGPHRAPVDPISVLMLWPGGTCAHPLHSRKVALQDPSCNRADRRNGQRSTYRDV